MMKLSDQGRSLQVVLRDLNKFIEMQVVDEMIDLLNSLQPSMTAGEYFQ